MLISHCNSTLNWIKVAGNVVSVLSFELLPLPQLLPDHLETVGIVPKLIIRVEAIQEFPIDHNVFASLLLIKQLIEIITKLSLTNICDWNVIQIDLKS